MPRTGTRHSRKQKKRRARWKSGVKHSDINKPRRIKHEFDRSNIPSDVSN